MPSFNSRFYRAPAVAVRNDLSGLATNAFSPGGILGIVGPADGGVPNVSLRFSNPNTARDYFRGGPLIEAALEAWSHGAATIFMVRIGNPTQASTVLDEDNPVSGALITVKSVDFGMHTNDIQIKVEDGTIPTTKKVSVLYEDQGNMIVDFVDNAADVDTVVDYFNNRSQVGLITMIKIGDGILKNIPYTNLVGGSGDGSTPMSLQQWQRGFDLLAPEFVDIVGPAGATDPLIHAMAQEHVTQMSEKNMERIAVVGGGTGEQVGTPNTPNTYAYRAFNMNSDRMVLVGPGTDGKSPAHTAAKVMGLMAGFDPAEPLTYKTITATALEQRWSKDQLDELVKYGITSIEQAPSGRRIVRDLTTIQDPNEWNENPTKTLSYRRIIDFCTINIRNILDMTFIGRKGFGAGTASQIASTVTTTLNRLKEKEIIANFRNVVCTQSQDDPRVYLVSYDIAPVSPILWIFVTQNFVGSIG